MIQSFKDLQIWNRSVDLSIEIYQATATFPKSELFGLTSQIRRAGVSPAANIAEGWSRKTSRSFHHFLDISRGSLAELYTHLEISRRLDFIPDLSAQRLMVESDEISKMIHVMQLKIDPQHKLR
ncbi:MAG TPA: four helix bundle protein [Bacteroidia bacterium]|jgi:four helix bundle protein|uniref:four helix bundle protein n=1 Tax=Candidatus Pollutiaquabacter sp. TaxID=3416354 RepID=UPI001A3DFDF6|nr:four helix bundle protein [Bacteroidota bacterium]MBL7949600.1 four helix bundle protein [Bacteroidia bacterium]HPD53479.1 four helix bundle protein [Bacteroidia bacterium]HRI40763.1 four helix bundle protein [Bacteroidia bacterium]HRS39974.1 four helix bundle protein [Bacteroidia bacterium]